MCLADVVQGIVFLRFLRLLPQPRQEVNEARVQKRDALEFVLAGDFFIAEATRQVHHLFCNDHVILVGPLRELEQDAVLDVPVHDSKEERTEVCVYWSVYCNSTSLEYAYYSSIMHT